MEQNLTPVQAPTLHSVNATQTAKQFIHCDVYILPLRPPLLYMDKPNVPISHVESCQCVSPQWGEDPHNTCSPRWWCWQAHSTFPSCSIFGPHSSAWDHLITHSKTRYSAIKWGICIFWISWKTNMSLNILQICPVSAFWDILIWIIIKTESWE